MKYSVIRLAIGLSCALMALPQHAHSAGNVIYACMNKSSGAIKIVSPGTTCQQNEQLLSWNIGSDSAFNGSTVKDATGRVIGPLEISDRDTFFAHVGPVQTLGALVAGVLINAGTFFAFIPLEGSADAMTLALPNFSVYYASTDCSGPPIGRIEFQPPALVVTGGVRGTKFFGYNTVAINSPIPVALSADGYSLSYNSINDCHPAHLQDVVGFIPPHTCCLSYYEQGAWAPLATFDTGAVVSPLHVE